MAKQKNPLDPTPEQPNTAANPENTPDSEKAPAVMTEKRRQALIRYMAVLFAAAFLLVLLSFLIQIRNNRNTIDALTATQSSALSNAQQLQKSNQQLIEQNRELNDRIEELNQQIDDAEDALREAESEKTRLLETLEAAEEEKKALEAQAGDFTEALEQHTLAFSISEALCDAATTYYAGDYRASAEALAEHVTSVLENTPAYELTESQRALYELLQPLVEPYAAD